MSKFHPRKGRYLIEARQVNKVIVTISFSPLRIVVLVAKKLQSFLDMLNLKMKSFSSD